MQVPEVGLTVVVMVPGGVEQGAVNQYIHWTNGVRQDMANVEITNVLQSYTIRFMDSSKSSLPQHILFPLPNFSLFLLVIYFWLSKCEVQHRFFQVFGIQFTSKKMKVHRK